MRRSELKSGSALRKTKLRNSNPERKARLFARQFGSRERVLWIQSFRCETCGSHPPSENSHLVGKRYGSASDIVPMCSQCHGLWHSMGPITFLEKVGRTLESLQREAARLEQLWQARGTP